MKACFCLIAWLNELRPHVVRAVRADAVADDLQLRREMQRADADLDDVRQVVVEFLHGAEADAVQRDIADHDLPRAIELPRLERAEHPERGDRLALAASPFDACFLRPAGCGRSS